MTTIQERAAEKAGRAAAQPVETAADEPYEPEPLPDHDIPEPGADGPEQVPVHVAWSRVMGTVNGIGKRGDYLKPGEFGHYKFRGVDSALNAFGPACRLHGVLVLPIKVEAAYRDVRTAKDKPSRECTVTVTYRIIGPLGDDLEVQSAGESMDTADKGTAKALSTSLRSLLFLGGLVPTNDPEPDSQYVERGDAPLRALKDYRDEVLEKEPSRARMVQINTELRLQGRLNELVTNENGDDEPISAFVLRKGAERFGGGS